MRKSEKMKELILSFKRKPIRVDNTPLPLHVLVDAKTDRIHTEKTIRKRIRLKRVKNSSRLDF